MDIEKGKGISYPSLLCFHGHKELSYLHPQGATLQQNGLCFMGWNAENCGVGLYARQEIENCSVGLYARNYAHKGLHYRKWSVVKIPQDNSHE